MAKITTSTLKSFQVEETYSELMDAVTSRWIEVTPVVITYPDSTGDQLPPKKLYINRDHIIQISSR